MKKLIATAAIAALVSGCANVDAMKTGSTRAISPMDSVVKIVAVDGGHGSGVHIGGGYILSAAHVFGGEIDHIEFENGDTEKINILWVNGDYDVALARIDGAKGDAYPLPSSELDCRAPTIGEPITAFGSPGIEDFISLHGYAASRKRDTTNWKSVVVADISGAGGISGGPVVSNDGNVIGIFVGGMLTQLARTNNPASASDFDISQTGVAYIVPADAACMLMGRL